MRSRSQAIVSFSQVTDAILIAAAVVLTWPRTTYTARELFLLLLVVPCWVSFQRYFGLYDSHRLQGLGGVTRSAISAQLTGILLLMAGMFFVGIHPHIRWFADFCIVVAAFILVQRWVMYLTLHLLRRRGYDVRNVLLIGDWQKAEKINESFRLHPEWGLRLSAIGTGTPGSRHYWTYPARQGVGGSLEDLLKSHVIDECLISVAAENLPSEEPTLQLCHDYGLLGRVLLDMRAAEPVRTRLESLGDAVSITVGSERQDLKGLLAKRIADVVLASILVLMLSPVMFIVAILVKLSSSGPVFFKQRRAGWFGRDFLIYKFRTMIDGADSLQASLAKQTVTRGPIYKNPNDWRITPVGRMLRRFSLDELPQLFNVLKGDMSLVGPRPLPLPEASAISGPHRRRFCMRPGITCVWQVSGRSDVEYSTWMMQDLQYVDGWTFWLDAKLLLQTIPAVLTGKGAY